MNFLPDLTTLSPLHVFLLTVLLTNYVEHPSYQWPLDYLTSESYCKSSNCEPNACSATVSDTLPKFDYIIVGSGPAGSTIAYRLTKHFPDRNVLLIEAGAEPSVESIAPKMWAFNLNTSVTHNYFAEISTDYGNAFRNGTDCMCGNQIGGSTGVNAMMYVCGTDKNYNNWAALTYDRSWSYENILPLIKKNQNNQDPKLTSGQCADYHGTDGPLVVTSSDFDVNEDSLWPILKAAVEEKGSRQLDDINCGPPYTGLVNVQSTVNAGERESAARAFLVPIRNNSNFYFMKESFVNKVYFKKENRNLLVKGVSVLTKQPSCKKIILQAKREVILSAGAYGSPQILLRSGIGRERDLRTCNIYQYKDLPVGRYLSDHFLSVHYYLMPGNLTSTIQGAQAYFGNEGGAFIFNHTGYFTTAGFNHNWFINTKDRNSDYPDMQIVFGVLDQNLLDIDVFFKEKLGFKDEFADQLIAANLNYSLIQIANVLLQPKSRGNVKLRDCNNPFAPPIINANYLDDKRDYDTVLRSINIINDFMNSNAVKSAGIRQVDLKIPECDIYKRNSENYNRCYIKYFSQNLWHPTGTCRMGYSSDENVVDSKLRVFGVRKTSRTPMLRVADASVMPLITSGNTQCPVYAIGEKAAATIIDDNY
ncbi:hypothetical protein PVAND_012695 [Polypedilum vanderplanki]|uniref:Glucose-methanol-choline oxidoreductase N-terminal domain-containing protein n=1 Tax=Polypedilum vanderplanki TaxID=319348 RepID=A0A9J6CNB4_POLVA|nr:hypothetical protein PVAND_012695 [Polypedilum vanderplanki]